jgi:predicted aspartyl protease
MRRKPILAVGFLAFLAWALLGSRFILADAEGVAPATTKKSADFRLISGAESVVPFSVEAGTVVIDVRINGRGPFPMIFDTGAEDTLTPEAAAALGLKLVGSGSVQDSAGRTLPTTYTKVQSVRIRDAEMTDQRFAVLGLSPQLADRGTHAPIAGLIGYELLARFAARLDYDSGILTLKPGPDFRYDGKGLRVPLVFSDKIPTVRAAADGISSMFVIDTGSVGALTLRRNFVEEHGLAARHPSAVRVKSVGTAGPFEMLLTRLDSFEVAESRIARPATRFPAAANEGLPFTDADGSIGYEILRQFVITFDYGRNELWFEHSSAFGTRTGQGSAGFQAVRVIDSGFKVITVLPSTAAAEAGIQIGDLIAAVDGTSTASLSLSEFAALIRRPPGTLVHFEIIRDGNSRPVALVLRDVLP